MPNSTPDLQKAVAGDASFHLSWNIYVSPKALPAQTRSCGWDE